MHAWLFFLISTALAAPPSSTLKGSNGTLKWTVTEASSTVTVDGQSPLWKVHHTATADLLPKRTRIEKQSGTVEVSYGASSTTVKLADGDVVTHERTDLWDGDTLDIRLGHLYAKGKAEQVFHAIDTDSGKVYKFDSQLVEKTTCGSQSCGHVLVQLTGMLRYVGPSFHYYFAENGQLLKFEGRAGTFTAGGAQ